MAKRPHIKLSDGINVLPDEILVCILSFLPVKEAAATSILGRRWRYLWTFITNLDFDGSDFYWRVGSRLKHFGNFGEEFLQEVWSILKFLDESWNYIAWVNDVLGLHRGSSIEEFRVDFLLYVGHKKHIDRWLSFASAKKVKRLELNLRWTPCFLGQYIFPCELFINFKHIRTMRLQWANVTREGVELLLGSSPLLEELSVSLSSTLGVLKITGASLALKRLEICCCCVTSIEIHDVKLEFLMYDGGVLQTFVLKNVPLVEMHLGGSVLSQMKDLLIMFSSYLPQLEKLTIDGTHMSLPNVEYVQDAKMFYNTVKMSNLHQLKFKYHRMMPDYIVPVTYFIRASPLLQNFVLELHGGSKKDEHLYFVKRLSTNEKLVAYKYPHLKRVEMIGYRGTSSELALALHLLKNGIALEQFIVDLRKRDDPQYIHNYFWPNSVKGGLPVGYPYEEEDEINALKARVKQQLIKGVPLPLQQHLHLNIL